MKIGILTFHRALNYGAVLQCYGLSETLKSLGHEVEIIDYRPEYIERYRCIIPFFLIRHTKGLVNKIKIIISAILSFFHTLDANKRFDTFLNKHFTFSEIVHTPDEIPQKYDTIIIGSDQVWSPQICYGFDPIYWGQFQHPSTKLIGYAVSMGSSISKMNENMWKKIYKFAVQFDKLSVRENQLQTELRQQIGVNSCIVVDPTILAEKSIFEHIAIRPQNIPEKYILVFSVAHADNLVEFSEIVASQMDSKIITISAKKTTNMSLCRHGSSIELNPSIEEFLGLFKYAQSVVTTSFHGTVFSVLFKKNFYSLSNQNQCRAQYLLKEIGLGHRLISPTNDNITNFHIQPINYDIVEEKLCRMKQSSHDFISLCENV